MDRKRLGLDTPRELLAKLDWEIEQASGVEPQKEAVASYRAFNCAVTAWSICDWVWNSASKDLRNRFKRESPKPNAKGSEPLAALLRKRSRQLAICQQLANGSKHFVLKKYNDPAVSSKRLPSMTYLFSDDGKEGRVAAGPSAMFIEDGSQMYGSVALFSEVRDFWRDFFNKYEIGGK